MSEAPDIEFSVRVLEGGDVQFESKLTVAMTGREDDTRKAVEGWMEMMQAGLKISQALSVQEVKP